MKGLNLTYFLTYSASRVLTIVSEETHQTSDILDENDQILWAKVNVLN